MIWNILDEIRTVLAHLVWRDFDGLDFWSTCDGIVWVFEAFFLVERFHRRFITQVLLRSQLSFEIRKIRGIFLIGFPLDWGTHLFAFQHLFFNYKPSSTLTRGRSLRFHVVDGVLEIDIRCRQTWDFVDQVLSRRDLCYILSLKVFMFYVLIS